MITRGTTPTVRYTFTKVSVENIQSAYLTIQQGETVVTKTLADADTGDGYIEWTLSQAETLSFHEGFIEVQCKYKLTDGKVYASKVVVDEAWKILHDEVI